MVAADRGHAVTVMERDGELGGQLRAWSAASFLNTEIEHMINFYKVELERLKVEVQLNTEASEADLEKYDEVLLATGTVTDDKPGGALDAVDLLTARSVPEAAEITVYGDTEVAMFAALWLAEQGRDVTLSSPGDSPGADTNDMERDRLCQLLESSGVTIRTGQVPPEKGAVVWAQDRRADDALASSANRDTVRVIGTRARGGRMYEATQSGFWTASTL